LQENSKYCVILVLKTVIHKSELPDFHPPEADESLVFEAFLTKTEKKE
jgi:hypothetical protein